jgi:ABC-type dipeptide/oligopeptide/nickel transport system permease component
VALFGVVILVGNVLRLVPGTSSMAMMAAIYRDGSTPEREEALYRRLSLTHPIILTMYACVVASVFIGVLKL